ncbi:MAG: GNAT family N-acetyltransferase [Lachnospiraceae bacterium]|nr:GNAT family N-acetyltransferase [Lachnospiraceae bacterium]
MTIRLATPKDAEEISKLESICFPAAEAASRETFEKRLKVYPRHFAVAEEDGKIISVVNGLATDFEDLTDEMFADTSFHCEKGDWQMIFGVETHPDHQRKGVAGEVLKFFISKAKNEGRKGLVLTCKEKLIGYYSKFGFVNEGVSVSEHGGAEWYQMRLTF